MTIAVDLGRKATKQTNKNSRQFPSALSSMYFSGLYCKQYGRRLDSLRLSLIKIRGVASHARVQRGDRGSGPPEKLHKYRVS